MRARRGNLIIATAALALAALGVVLARRTSRAPGHVVRTGTFSNGIEFEAVGSGSRTMLLLPGGPGVNRVIWARAGARLVRPLAEAGFTVWRLRRRRGMPPGHTIADMADDVAHVIEEEFHGHVEAVVGVSYGGLVAQHLAARHPASVGHVVLDASAATITDEGREADRRFGEALGHGRFGEAGQALLGISPGDSPWSTRHLLGLLLGRVAASSGNNLPDVLIETQAEMDFDARPVLHQITSPVLLIAGDKDTYFSQDAVEETARLIPDCTVVWYRGADHGKTAMNRRVPRDVIAFVGHDR